MGAVLVKTRQANMSYDLLRRCRWLLQKWCSDLKNSHSTHRTRTVTNVDGVTEMSMSPATLPHRPTLRLRAAGNPKLSYSTRHGCCHRTKCSK